MSNITGLTNKIIGDAKVSSKEIMDDAKKKEKIIIDEKVSIAENERKLILSKAEEESKVRAGRIISNANLQVRDMKLSAKIEVLDNVFNAAVEELSRMTEGELLNFIKNTILLLDIDGDEEIIVGENEDRVTTEFINEINKELKAKGKLGKIKLSQKRIKIKGGYILAKNGIEINNTFESRVKSLRDDMEAEVAKVLFS
ncbi:ATP synthase subunit E [Clostridium novyi A str. BKT29909]|uniref:V-type ATP synthase subunit E n=1 Tax=Clostridium novyi TaxID=1542 RepID=UPI0004D93C89|nr:V-type ATP synthase subunit E family protein [Clostridium novyi]KEH87520.1 ATP synthase subunit E [Clostridium novyi A str. BKT29909]